MGLIATNVTEWIGFALCPFHMTVLIASTKHSGVGLLATAAAVSFASSSASAVVGPIAIY